MNNTQPEDLRWVEGRYFFLPYKFSYTVKQPHAPKTNVDTHAFHTPPVVQNGQPSDEARDD